MTRKAPKQTGAHQKQLGILAPTCAVYELRNRTGAPNGDTLGLMNPLSRKSFNYSFNSLSSAGAILYGGIEMGYVSKRKSISKSISLLGETLRRSSGNTSGNSHATETDSRFGVSELES
ncbi:hypothetical protein CQW23_15756 [Capsicum baccatum]|uniref:Uncharacterized protein n=1 Tax=Capsicum baccatum TaxID=33114 RepID=A0A2G2WMZ1_CAPBA|nr:hypothetical protein CQW23_15756 [Capsicum baccatum]